MLGIERSRVGPCGKAGAASRSARLKEAMSRIMALSPERRDGRGGRLPINPDLAVRKIAGRILGPRIAGELQRPDARVSAADGLERARPAAPFQRPRALAKVANIGSSPVQSLAERRLLHVADL